MEGSSNTSDGFQQGINENVIDVPLPNVPNAMPAAEHGIPNPNHEDGLILNHDARREQNRGHSETNQLRKKAHVQNFEQKQNTLMQTTSQEETGSVLQTEHEELQKSLSKVTLNEEDQKATLNRLMCELEMRKIIKEANEAEMERRRDFRI